MGTCACKDACADKQAVEMDTPHEAPHDPLSEHHMVPKAHRSCTACHAVDCSDPPVERVGDTDHNNPYEKNNDTFLALPALSSPRADEPPYGHVDLTGKWKLHSIDGDMDKFMDDLGIGYMLRSVASAANFGIGRTTHEVSHSGNEFECKIAGIKTSTTKFTIGAGEQTIETPDGNKTGTPSWVDDGKGVELKTDRATIKRYIKQTWPTAVEYCLESTCTSTCRRVTQKFIKAN